MQADLDGNGIIDGDASLFGQNGLFNAIASDPDKATAVETYTRFDIDGDSVPDHDDLDADNDGINDVAEANFGTSDTNGDGRIDDGKGNPPTVSPTGLAPILDPLITNAAIPLPQDTDLDGVPDWHDLDSDNDGINDVAESIINGTITDADGDGIIGIGNPIVDDNGQAIADTADNQLSTTSTPVNTDNLDAADFRDLDADGDGINDVNEADHPDLDGDGIIGTGTPIVNDSGQILEDAEGVVLNTISNPEDTDTDEHPDFQDIDRDGDGIADAYECPGGWPCINTDDDALPDVDDLDSDDDKLLDHEECPGGAPCPDTNTNTIDNFLEYDCNSRNTPTPQNPIGGGQFCEGTPIELNASGDTAFSEMIQYIWEGPNDFEFSQNAPANTTFPVELADISAEASGTYELILETERGCQSKPLAVELDLMETPTAPILSIKEQKLCVGEDALLEVNTFTGETVNYIWFQQIEEVLIVIDTTETAILPIENIQTTALGTYAAIVAVNGCESSISNDQLLEVSVPIEQPEITASATMLNPACAGETVTLSVPSIEGATYEWSGPNNFSAIQPTVNLTDATNSHNGGNYSVLVSVDGCAVRSNEVTVLINDQPETPVLRMVQDRLCEGEAATLRIIDPVSYPENNIAFNWYTTGNSTPIRTTESPTLIIPNVSESDNGEYYVEATLLGCSSTASNLTTLEVQPQIPVTATSSATVENPGCTGDMIRLTGTLVENATYEWFGPNGLISDKPSVALTDATPAIDGNYIFVATIDNCPSTSQPVTVQVNPTPMQPNLVLDETSPCLGEDVTLSINNISNLTVKSIVTVEWFDATTETIIHTTDDLDWQITDVDAENVGLSLIHI